MKKIIPPILTLLCALLSIVLHSFTVGLPLVGWHLVGILLIPLGLYVFRTSVQQIKQAQTEIHTFKKPKVLLDEGNFSRSRNPIYLGFLMFLLGVASLFGSIIAFTGPFIFFLAAQFWYIPFEEKNMLEEFGHDYTAYQQRVRRWI